MPASWKHQQDWQREQEHNLLYVALTRDKQKLFIVGDANWCRNLDDFWKQHLRKCNAGDMVLSPCSRLLVES
jgi:ATP-dependent exoDNAse (exonuclease V) beta subunit